MFCDSSLQCHRLVCGVWLWYFLIILTFFNIALQVIYDAIYISYKINGPKTEPGGTPVRRYFREDDIPFF